MGRCTPELLIWYGGSSSVLSGTGSTEVEKDESGESEEAEAGGRRWQGGSTCRRRRRLGLVPLCRSQFPMTVEGCDLFLIANGWKEKTASGLLNPFLAHLKVAQDQIAKGGYSITLEPDPETDAPWFTRGTVERFVRFVSTPEVLERVTMIESEILQIEDAIAVQSNDTLGLKSVEDHQGKLVEGIEGSKASYDLDADRAIVLYKPGSQPTPPVQNENTTQEENSKVQLLRVLETRKTVLRKEQAMAFARAVAAGFDIDNLGCLITFAECFGASRLMKACMQFIELWRRKHENGQWIEVEPEAMSTRSEFPPFNATGIMFMGDNMKQNMEAMSVSNGEANGEDAAKADQKTGQAGGPHEYFQGPYQAGYPPWAMHPLSGSATYPPYPMQAMPYYPGMNPYYPPPYPPMDDPRYHHSERRVSRKHSSDSKDSETLDDGSDQSGLERESSHGRKHRKGKRSGKKKPSVVVIRNVNVTSKRHGSSESNSQSGSDVESEDSDDSHNKSREKKHKSSSSKKKEGRKITVESGDEYNKDETSYGQDGDQGNWNVFQSFLLKAEEKTRANDADMFSCEKEPPLSRRKENRSIADPILLAERDSGNVDERKTVGFNAVNGRARTRQLLSNDELLMSGEGRGFMDGDIKEIEAGGGGYRRGTSDDFMVYGQEKLMDQRSSLDPLAEAQYRSPIQVDKNMYGVTDESFMIPLRSSSQDNHGPESRTAIDIDVELPTTGRKTSDAKAGSQLFYEPDELMPERRFEDVSFGYDPAMDYDSQMPAQTTAKVEDTNVEDVPQTADEEVKKPEKEKKLRKSQDDLDKRRKDALARRLSMSKAPVNEAQKRAQNLRAYKADLQKAKKEQEEEQIKRLERLKQERQKRIAARSTGTNSTSTPQKAKEKPSPKISPGSYKSSKFSDSEPGSSSPLRKLPARSTPGSDPQKTAKASKLSENTNGVSKSVSSLTEMKKDKTVRTESSSERLKRLAEPKSNAASERASNPKSASVDHSRRGSMPEETQMKKISAIVQLDQSKSATLPELKMKSPRAPAVVVQKKTAIKEAKEERTGAKAPSASDSTDGRRANGKPSRQSNSDESVVVEKTVVMLENEVFSSPPVILPPGKSTKIESCSDDRKEKPGPEFEYTAIQAPPPVLPEAEDRSVCRPDARSNSYEVVLEYRKDEPQKPTLATMEKPYQAPFARATSMEDALAKSPAYPQSLPSHESETLVHTESIRAWVPEPATVVLVEETHEVNEKPRSKESKGFRKLLKFGRKSHASTSAEGTVDTDASSVDEATAGAVPSNDGSMLKNLISQDDSGTSSKASRSFSLLSPFRSKQKVIVL